MILRRLRRRLLLWVSYHLSALLELEVRVLNQRFRQEVVQTRGEATLVMEAERRELAELGLEALLHLCLIRRLALAAVEPLLVVATLLVVVILEAEMMIHLMAVHLEIIRRNHEGLH